MIRVVPTGDLGLDVLLGGGWRLVKRFEDRESATVVVRGGSGAGKTLMGIQVALELAKALGGDVAVGCVEILPTEYVAQLQSARSAFPRERVATLPATIASAVGPRVYVGLLADLNPDKPDLIAGLETLETSVKAAGGDPKVFIVDSLIEGYGIGSNTPRIDVDDVLKFAARYGYGLVLCEEVATDGPSPWVFAADTVLQLGVESRERGRWIEVRKHRFGPSATGRHELELAGWTHPEVYPDPGAWRSMGARTLTNGDVTRPRPPPLELGWNETFQPHKNNIPFSGNCVVVACNGEGPAGGFAFALRALPTDWVLRRVIGLDPTVTRSERSLETPLHVDYLPTYQGVAKVLRRIVDTLIPGQERKCVVIGDLRHVLSGPDAEAWVDVVSVVTMLVLEARPNWTVIFFDGDMSRSNTARDRLYRDADVFVAVYPSHETADASIVARQSTQIFSASWSHTTYPRGVDRAQARRANRLRSP